MIRRFRMPALLPQGRVHRSEEAGFYRYFVVLRGTGRLPSEGLAAMTRHQSACPCAEPLEAFAERFDDRFSRRSQRECLRRYLKDFCWDRSATRY